MDNANGFVHGSHAFNDFECDILPFAITIQPQAKRLTTPGFLLNLLYTLVKSIPTNCIFASYPLSLF